jgi:hypothetical protein
MKRIGKNNKSPSSPDLRRRWALNVVSYSCLLHSLLATNYDGGYDVYWSMLTMIISHKESNVNTWSISPAIFILNRSSFSHHRANLSHNENCCNISISFTELETVTTGDSVETSTNCSRRRLTVGASQVLYDCPQRAAYGAISNTRLTAANWIYINPPAQGEDHISQEGTGGVCSSDKPSSWQAPVSSVRLATNGR